MGLLLRLLGIWGIADGVWLAVDPQGWARFWGRMVGKAAEGQTVPRTLAAFEIIVGAYVVLRRKKEQVTTPNT